MVGDYAGDHVGTGAGTGSNDDLDRAGGVALRVHGARGGRCDGERAEATDGKLKRARRHLGV
jgi:hypothetical protein